jgi:hypothetical protein
MRANIKDSKYNLSSDDSQSNFGSHADFDTMKANNSGYRKGLEGTG